MGKRDKRESKRGQDREEERKKSLTYLLIFLLLSPLGMLIKLVSCLYGDGRFVQLGIVQVRQLSIFLSKKGVGVERRGLEWGCKGRVEEVS